MKPWRVWLARACSAVAAGAAALLSYGFGQQIGGLWLGLLLALNGAVFAALLVGMAFDYFEPRLQPPQQRP